MPERNICLLNDSFPPQIDGVANAVINYAAEIQKSGSHPIVVTPECLGANDSSYPYPVLRYPGLNLSDTVGYTAGYPFSRKTALALKDRNIELLHSHCPAASTMLARGLREVYDVPIVITYHTKFDIDIANLLHSRLIQEGAINALVDNVSACDEVWVVSRGAGENLRSLGYKGDYVVMTNGVDMPRGRIDEETVRSVTAGYDLPEGVPVYLFVGRLMWYKGLRIILDALAGLNSQQIDYRMVFIGAGGDETEIKQYAGRLKLDSRCIFTGAIHDRTELAAWYCRADMFLFPSSFDTNGLVVREAAAFSLPSVMIDGSCAAEGVERDKNGFMIDENAASLAVLLTKLHGKKDAVKKIGEAASRDLYISWHDSVNRAMERYEVVIDNYVCGKYSKKKRPSDEVFKLYGDLTELFMKADERRGNLKHRLDRYL